MSLCSRYVVKVSAMNLDLQYISSTQPLPELQALESLFPSMHIMMNYLVSIVIRSAGSGGSRRSEFFMTFDEPFEPSIVSSGYGSGLVVRGVR